MSWYWWGVKCILYEIVAGRTHKLSQGLRSRGNMNWKLNKKLLYYKAKLGLVSPFFHLTSEHDDLVSQYLIIKITHGYVLPWAVQGWRVCCFYNEIVDHAIAYSAFACSTATNQKKLPFDHFSYIFGWGKWIGIQITSACQNLHWKHASFIIAVE